MFVKSAAVLFSLAASALGNVFITSPTASSTFTGGQQALIKWQDDGAAPNLTAFGISKVSIYVGNAIQQTQLQLITDNVDVSKVATIQFVVNPAIGPNGADYFIRVESLNLKDTKQPQFPALAFSAKYSMSGMTGTFNSTVQAQINGQSTAPLSSPTGAGLASNLPSAAKTTGTTNTGTTSHTSTAATGTATKTGTNNAGVNLKTSGIISFLLAAVVGATMV